MDAIIGSVPHIWLVGDVAISSLRWQWDSAARSFQVAEMAPGAERNVVAAMFGAGGNPLQLTLTRIEVVVNHRVGAATSFTNMLAKLEGQLEDSAFNVSFGNDSQKPIVLQRLASAYSECQGGAKMLLAWMGCSPGVADKICANGVADLCKIDCGYFGAGIYLTLQVIVPC